MSEIITVQRVETRPQTSKFSKPGVPSYVYEVYGTNGQKYEHGFKDPKVAHGETITAEIDYTKYGPKITSFTRGSTPGSAMSVGPVVLSPASTMTGTGGLTINPPVVIQHTPVRDGFLQGSRPFPLPTTHGDRSFVRQHALAQAVEVITTIMSSEEVTSEAVIELARKFEAYCSGQDDLLAAEKIVAAQAQISAAVSKVNHQQQMNEDIQQKLKASQAAYQAKAVPGNVA